MENGWPSQYNFALLFSVVMHGSIFLLEPLLHALTLCVPQACTPLGHTASDW